MDAYQKISVCQSCGMPMAKIEEFGSNKNDSKNDDYCIYCFQKGSFTSPNITLDQMIEKIVQMHDQMGITEEDARKMAKENLPKLKRWVN
jgi:hypothetical protein